MRKSLIISLIIMALLVVYTTGALAAGKTQVDVYDQQKNLVKSVVFVIGKDEYFVNGQTPGVKMDAKPFIESSRTFVPIRYLSNALGVGNKHIGWESPKVTLSQSGMPVVELEIGSKVIKSNNTPRTMDVSPVLKSGRTYLPARFVAEALGYQVAWDAENNIVLCWPRGGERPDVSNVIKYIKGQQPVATDPVNQPTTPEQPVTTEDVVQFTGKPLSPNDYEAHGGWAIPYEFKQPGASIMYVTVDELRQHPVKLGNDGYKIIYDVKVTKDDVYVTQAGDSLRPAVMVLAIGNDVSRQRCYPMIKHPSNPFTQAYTVSLDADPTPTKIEDITHIMLMYSNQVLAVENPLYKGGK